MAARLQYLLLLAVTFSSSNFQLITRGISIVAGLSAGLHVSHRHHLRRCPILWLQHQNYPSTSTISASLAPATNIIDLRDHVGTASNKNSLHLPIENIFMDTFNGSSNSISPPPLSSSPSSSSWNRPCIIRNVFAFDNEAVTNDMISCLGKKRITYDARKETMAGGSKLRTFATTLREFVSTLAENSDHEDNMYMMDEDILRSYPPTKSSQLFSLPEKVFGKDYFELFPTHIRPKSALIIGGTGARSFLHVDPFEWIGWNYLLEGRKLWTFFPPETSLEILQAYEQSPDAWKEAGDGDGDKNDADKTSLNVSAPHRRRAISTGFVSPFDIYRRKQGYNLRESVDRARLRVSSQGKGTDTDTNINTGASRRATTNKDTRRNSRRNAATRSAAQAKLQLASLDVKDPHLRSVLREEIGDVNLLWVDSCCLGMSTAHDNQSYWKLPVFKSGMKRFDFMDTSTRANGSFIGSSADLKGAVQIIQEEGELVWIPPNWWHQVYHLQPSVAVASQICNDMVKDRVFRHILGCTSKDNENCNKSDSNSDTGKYNAGIDYSRSPTLTDMERQRDFDLLHRKNTNVPDSISEERSNSGAEQCWSVSDRKFQSLPPEEQVRWVLDKATN